MTGQNVHENVRKAYGQAAAGGGCCAPASLDSTRLGYNDKERDNVPEGADLGLGCGNPGAIAALREGETVLDLGSGAGFDGFLAAAAVGKKGHVIGVDMTPEMLAKARANAKKGGYANIEFREGLIENLPVADASIDVVISNCVINLSPDKPQVFREAFRVLKPGGRLAVSDVVALGELPEAMRSDTGLHCACIGGAATVADLTAWLEAAGFTDIRIRPKAESADFIRDWAPGQGVEQHVASAEILAAKPQGASMTAEQPALHSAVVSMVSLAAGIAANHPDMGQCQLGRLRDLSVPEHQIQAVIEIARHIRDEAAAKLDTAFDERASGTEETPPPARKPLGIAVAEAAPAACCGTTASGQSCC